MVGQSSYGSSSSAIIVADDGIPTDRGRRGKEGKEGGVGSAVGCF